MIEQGVTEGAISAEGGEGWEDVTGVGITLEVPEM